jgi:hypothetical protein
MYTLRVSTDPAATPQIVSIGHVPRSVSRWVRTAVTCALMGAAGSAALAQQPPDVVQSDDFGNTAMGTSALLSATPEDTAKPGRSIGSYNTAAGLNALYSNTTGADNTAIGTASMSSNLTGNQNTATGYAALTGNTVGQSNTAAGYYSLSENTSGSFNVASGDAALERNATGSNNTAVGASALELNEAGNANSAYGWSALQNASGNDNTAVGASALISDSSGQMNTATGMNSLYSNLSGNGNTALGHSALKNSIGDNNLGLGANGGYNLAGGSNNIEIANQGLAGDSGAIRIGTSGTQTSTYIAGIENSKVTGSAVYVTANGQLGVLASSERYKTDIVPLGTSTHKLAQLRPVSFHLKSQPGGEVQYGLIAEEVAKVYPELVTRDAAGNIQGVRYDEIAPLLLNEVQRQQQRMNSQAAALLELKRQQEQMRRQVADLVQLNQSMQAALLKLKSADERVAMQ